jgi:phosphoenolpyruvate phosphomutase
VSAEPLRRTTRLRRLLESPELELMLEAHSGLSARIVEEAGLAGIWASGLALSAQAGVRDANETSWTQVVEAVEFMADATSLPILLDGDTGYGNFNNMRRLVRKLEQRGIAGVCIEDKVFPKQNSFVHGERQELADVEDFCGKIKAAKDTQRDPDFCVVARVEALITGHDMSDALCRAEAYHRAGADAIVIHSKRKQPDEILEFMERWGRRAPVVIIPTTYYSTPLDVFRNAGVSVVIWANHLIRAATQAMQQVARRIAQDGTVLDVEDRIVSVQEIFRLQGAQELEEAERRYLGGARNARRSAVVLGATQGEGLGDLTSDRPKMMVEVAGKPILRRLADDFKSQGVDTITAVTGYCEQAVRVAGVATVSNPAHATSGELASLACAADRFTEDTLICYGDLLFRRYVLADLLASPAELTVVVDSAPHGGRVSGSPDYAYCSRPDDLALWPSAVTLERLSTERVLDGRAADGRWLGMVRAQGAGVGWLREALAELQARPGFEALAMRDLLNHLIDQGREIAVTYITGRWLDVNSLRDLERADSFAAQDR